MMVYSHRSELIDDHGNAAAVFGGQYAVEQRGLPEPRKPVRIITDALEFGLVASRLIAP